MQPPPPPMSQHVHGPNCSHSHSHPHMHEAPEIPRVFFVYAFFSCTMFQRFFLQLPLMGQFFQIYQMAKMFIWNQPLDFYFQGVSGLVQRLPSKNLGRLFGGFAIPFFLANYFSISYVIHHQIPDLESPYTLDFLLKCSMVSSLILYVILFFMDPGFLTSEEDRQELKNIMQKRPEIGNPRNFCHFCSQPRIARSSHCNFCESCVTKWEKHSFVLNRCIGAGNQLLYIFFEFSYTILSLILLSGILMRKTSPHPHTFWGSLMFFVVLYNFLTSAQETLVQTVSVFYNITSFELMNCRRLNYLWKNKYGEFFNPFDKGPFHNVKESFESLMPQTPNPPQNDIEQNQDLPLNNPENIINWRKMKIFTVLDIPNSPLREVLLEEMRKMNINPNFNPNMNNNPRFNNNNGMGMNNNPQNIGLMNKKENPFENEFQGGAQTTKIETEKNEETIGLVTKQEETNNPFTN